MTIVGAGLPRDSALSVTPARGASPLLQVAAVDFAAEDDGGRGFFHALDAADPVEQLVQLFGGVAAQPGYVVELATDRTQLLDLSHGAQAAHHVLAGARLHGDADIRLQAAIHHALPQAHAVAADDLGLFQARQARGDGRAGDAQLAGEHGDAFAGVDLQQRDQLAVDFIEGDGAAVGHGHSLAHGISAIAYPLHLPPSKAPAVSGP